jgi:hypothetical protein
MKSVFQMAFALLVLADDASFAYPANKGQTRAVSRLEGLAYPAARKIILGYGWVPFRGGCLENESLEVCTKFPELINCTQGQPEFCILRFSKPGRCLEITTRGGYLEDNGGTEVEQVGFINRKCIKTF